MAANSNKPLQYASVWFGTDPELFLQNSAGQIVGSEAAVPKSGQAVDPRSPASWGSVVRDGVQVELHPQPSHCRQALSLNIAQCLRTLNNLALPKQLTVSFRPVVEMDPAIFEGLHEDSKQLGCAPSLNAYDVTANIYVDGASYLTRSAGGHIHLGLLNLPYVYQHRERLPQLLDILVGNTAVLFDRDPSAAKRREVYGRAGEYRLPAHGLEYRTLSNFWMHSIPLFSLMFALARQAVSVLHTEGVPNSFGWDAPSELLKLVNIDKVQRAINENNLELACENFEGVQKFVRDHINMSNCSTGLLSEHLGRFESLIQRVQKDGLNSVWPHDPFTRWDAITSSSYTGPHGWENFITDWHPDNKTMSL